MDFILPKNVKYVIDKLGQGGYRADVVGGSVRDILLGKEPDDYDITTNALPEQTKFVFSADRTVDTGIKHGTVSIILDGSPYEVTTYRIDGDYKDSRHPESVSFTTDIEKDLARRDFTVNAMAFSPEFGLTDPFGGRRDLEGKIIRAVGDPALRFGEDALRILRALRFSATLGFDIEENTAAALRDKKHLLKNVSAERIYTELRKMISAPYAYSVVDGYSDVILAVIPSLDRILLPREELFVNADYVCRLLSVFYLSSADPTGAFYDACTALRTDSHIRDIGLRALSAVGRYDLLDEISLCLLLRDFGIEVASCLVGLEVLLGNVDKKSVPLLQKVIDSGACYRLSDLAVGGEDMKSIGISGKDIGNTLNELLTAVIDRRLPNEREELIALAKKINDKN
ncbi:MAG: hypothetical protein IJX97_04945 [Clostridia bacterium]|nr:hypothetical protein [Clostridia bacterium]